jgi:hypothetical protein
VLAVAAGAQPAPAPLTLPELMQRMAGTRGVEAAFLEVREVALLASPLESRGRLYFLPPDRLARFTTAPGFTALLVDGERVRFRDSEGESDIDLSSNPAARVFVDSFVPLWSGDLERLERLYETDFHAEGSDFRLELLPRRAPLRHVIETITLRGDDGGLRSIEVLDKDGDRTVTRFQGTRLDRPFSPEEIERLFDRGLPLADP